MESAFGTLEILVAVAYFSLFVFILIVCLKFALYMISVEGILVQYFVSIIYSFFSPFDANSILLLVHSSKARESEGERDRAKHWDRFFVHLPSFIRSIFLAKFAYFVCFERVHALSTMRECRMRMSANKTENKIPVNDRDKRTKRGFDSVIHDAYKR